MPLVTMAPCSLHLSDFSVYFALAFRSKTKIRSLSSSFWRLWGKCNNLGFCFCIKKYLWWRGGCFVISSSAVQHKSTCCACVLFSGVLGFLGALSSAEGWGSSCRPRCVMYHLAGTTEFSVASPRTSLFCPGWFVFVLFFYRVEWISQVWVPSFLMQRPFKYNP